MPGFFLRKVREDANEIVLEPQYEGALDMNKKMWIMIFVLPNLQAAASLLRMQDENTTGADDEAAEALEHAAQRLNKWLSATSPTPSR